MLSFDYFLKVFEILFKGVPNTLFVSLLALIGALIIGIIVGIISYQKIPVLHQIAKVYVSIFRSTPAIAQIFLFYYGIGAISYIVNRMNPLVAAAIVLALNSGAYISETIRGALLSVESGQIEAGRALGMSNRNIMWKIVLPQAFPIAIPTLFGNFINLVKGSSITFMIGVPDIMGLARTEGALSFRYLEIYIAVMIVYWAITNVLTLFFKFLINKFKLDKVN